MNPKFHGVASAIAKLNHSLEAQSEKLLDRIEATSSKSDVVFKQAHASLDQAETALSDVNTMLDQVAASNGGPTSDGSAESSVPHLRTYG